MKWLDAIQSIAVSGLCVLVVAIGGYAMLQDRRLDEAIRARDAAMSELDVARRAIIEMERNNLEKALSETAHRKGREAILAMPVDEDEQLSPMLLQALRSADEIGGLK